MSLTFNYLSYTEASSVILLTTGGGENACPLEEPETQFFRCWCKLESLKTKKIKVNETNENTKIKVGFPGHTKGLVAVQFAF